MDRSSEFPADSLGSAPNCWHLARLDHSVELGEAPWNAAVRANRPTEPLDIQAHLTSFAVESKAYAPRVLLRQTYQCC